MSTFSAMTTQFRPTLWRCGYDPDQVDAFVETVEDALRSPTPQVSASAVAWQRFTPVLLKPGYRMDDVDHYLEDAEHRLGERERLT